MKKILISALLAAIAFTACKNDNYLQYDTSAPGRLQFGPVPAKIYLKNSNYEDTLKTRSFARDPETITRDTIYFDLYVMGGAKSSDRAFVVKQIQVPGTDNAVPGTHYVAFDDPAIKHEYIIPAGQMHVEVPVIMLRDVSLKTTVVTLKFQVVANDQFLTGQTNLLWRKLIFSGKLMKPSNWDRFSGMLKTWSVVRHQFLIDVTGKPWDETFIEAIGSDLAAQQYWLDMARAALVTYNASHNPALTDEFGNPVTF